MAAIVDPEGVPIHEDILQDNRYGPSIPGTDILSALQSFSQNCFLKDGLTKSEDTYAKYKYDPPSCSVKESTDNYTYYSAIDETKLAPQDVPKLRVLLRELHDLNETSNKFFQKREEQAVKILEKGGSQDNEYSLRLNYMNRRKETANSNSIALTIITIVFMLTLFTIGYLYFTKQIESINDYIILTLPFTIFIGAVFLGYIFVPNYALFINS